MASGRLKTSRTCPYPRLKNSKTTSKCQFTILENRKTKKHSPSGAPGPASASPGLANGGNFGNRQYFCHSLQGEHFGEKTNFQKKSRNAEKLKEGPFGIFKHPICCKISKKLKGGAIGENFFWSHIAKKLKTERGAFGVFEHPFCRKTPKN